MKLLAKLAVVGVLAIVALAVGLHLWLDSAVERAVEELAPKMTRSTVTLTDVDTSLIFGTAQVEGLAVGNPAGFNAPNAVVVRKARVRVDWKSLRGNTLVIDEIMVDGPEITFEGLLGKNNLNALKENVEAYAGTAKAKPAEPSPSKAGERKQCAIDDANLATPSDDQNGSVCVFDQLTEVIPQVNRFAKQTRIAQRR